MFCHVLRHFAIVTGISWPYNSFFCTHIYCTTVLGELSLFSQLFLWFFLFFFSCKEKRVLSLFVFWFFFSSQWLGVDGASFCTTDASSFIIIAGEINCFLIFQKLWKNTPFIASKWFLRLKCSNTSSCKARRDKSHYGGYWHRRLRNHPASTSGCQMFTTFLQHNGTSASVMCGTCHSCIFKQGQPMTGT